MTSFLYLSSSLTNVPSSYITQVKINDWHGKAYLPWQGKTPWTSQYIPFISQRLQSAGHDFCQGIHFCFNLMKVSAMRQHRERMSACLSETEGIVSWKSSLWTNQAFHGMCTVLGGALMKSLSARLMQLLWLEEWELGKKRFLKIQSLL